MQWIPFQNTIVFPHCTSYCFYCLVFENAKLIFAKICGLYGTKRWLPAAIQIKARKSLQSTCIHGLVNGSAPVPVDSDRPMSTRSMCFLHREKILNASKQHTEPLAACLSSFHRKQYFVAVTIVRKNFFLLLIQSSRVHSSSQMTMSNIIFLPHQFV